jgi:hypothetical protein
MVGSITLDIENDVARKETNSLLTGVFTEDQDINGWSYDLRLLMDLQSKSTQYLTTLGGHDSGLLDGFLQESWASGVVTGIAFDRVLTLKNHNAIQWVPRYRIGTFSIFNDVRRLYSDYSYMQLPTKDSCYELSHILLRDDCKQNTLSVALYKRLADGLIIAEKIFSFVDEFTGELDTERLNTEDESGLLVNNFSTRFNEYIIRGQDLYLNGLYEKKVGLGSSYDDIELTWESHNPEEGGYIFLGYLNPRDVQVAVLDDSGGVTLLPALSSIDYIDDTQVGYVLDADIGVIQVTGLAADPVIVNKDFNNIATSISCYYDENFIALPERGVVKIDSELVAYQTKGLQSLEDCIRGYQSTEATAHEAGAIASFETRGAFKNGSYYVKYTAVPRADYEITTHDLRTANKTNWLDVHPLTNLKYNKIIQIVSQTINLAEIVLSTGEPLIGGNLYGPVYFGTDVGHLTATGYDAAGNPVEDIEITIEKLYGPGSLNNSGDAVVAESNSSGEVYASYNAPYEEAEVTLEVSDIAYDGDDTLVTVPRLPAGVTPADIFIYQVLKHDPTLGTVGKKVKATAAGTAIDPWGLGYLECRCEYTEDFNDGTLQISYGGTRYSMNINHAMAINIPGDEPVTRFYVEEYFAFMASSPFVESTVWLYQPDAEVWDTALKRGAQVILYEWTTNYKHPKTGATGAYGPVRPESIAGTVLRYKGRHLPLPAPTDDSVNLGAYLIVSPAEARFRAYGRDPYSGSIITSNEIRFRVSLPNTLTGVDSSGVLPVPYGFTFITDEFNIGAGLGGSNFITVNPSASGINQLTLRGSI